MRSFSRSFVFFSTTTRARYDFEAMTLRDARYRVVFAPDDCAGDLTCANRNRLTHDVCERASCHGVGHGIVSNVLDRIERFDSVIVYPDCHAVARCQIGPREALELGSAGSCDLNHDHRIACDLGASLWIRPENSAFGVIDRVHIRVIVRKASLLGQGFAEDLAESTATAMVDGDMDTVIKNMALRAETMKQEITAGALRNTPRPPAGSENTSAIDYAKKIQEAQAAGNMTAAAYYTRLQAQETQTD